MPKITLTLVDERGKRRVFSRDIHEVEPWGYSLRKMKELRKEIKEAGFKPVRIKRVRSVGAKYLAPLRGGIRKRHEYYYKRKGELLEEAKEAIKEGKTLKQFIEKHRKSDWESKERISKRDLKNIYIRASVPIKEEILKIKVRRRVPTMAESITKFAPPERKSMSMTEALSDYEGLIDRIKGKTGWNRKEIKERIKKKQDEYGGLLTEHGAAYSIAKEIGALETVSFVKDHKRKILVRAPIGARIIKPTRVKPHLRRTKRGRVVRVRPHIKRMRKKVRKARVRKKRGRLPEGYVLPPGYYVD